MRIIASDEIESALSYPELIETLLRAYRSQTVTPAAASFDIARPEGGAGVLHAAPAWTNFLAQGHAERGYIGCSLSLTLTDAGTSPETGAPSGSALYALMSGTTGHPIALLDGTRLNAWRKCAQHALAVRYLSREDTGRLLVLGDTPLLPRLLAAYSSVRDIRSVLLLQGAEAKLPELQSQTAFKHITFGETDDFSGAVQGADMICVASGGAGQLAGFDLTPGVHIDIFQTHNPIAAGQFPEVRIFVCDREKPEYRAEPDIAADLKELIQGEKAGRRFYSQQTLFQASEPSGLADLAIAGHVYLRS